RVLRYSAAAYAGRVVSPPLARLQNDGNVIFGLGSALQEAIVYSEGAIANATLEQYKVPSTLDLPGELRSVCVETPGAAPVGIGEMTLPPVAPAIANAIEDAVGVRLRDLPLRPEAVLRALREQNQREER
ncbi:MAG TPA: molybdopterin-dependent oxidoreductase, partial [Chloroflexaceae bacterium]|nr:molybdopterin-dependent oxidoreductase [Chloroflexaceae bacterium]